MLKALMVALLVTAASLPFLAYYRHEACESKGGSLDVEGVGYSRQVKCISRAEK